MAENPGFRHEHTQPDPSIPTFDQLGSPAHPLEYLGGDMPWAQPDVPGIDPTSSAAAHGNFMDRLSGPEALPARPYSQNLLIEGTDHVLQHGPNFTPAGAGADHVHPGERVGSEGWRENAIAASGLGRLIRGPHGPEAKLLRLKHRERVASEIGRKMLDPRTKNPNTLAGAREKIGWTGIERTVEKEPWSTAEYFNQKNMLWNNNDSTEPDKPSTKTVYNRFRPMNGAERLLNMRMQRNWEAFRLHYLKADHLHHSLPEDGGQPTLTAGEARHLGGLAMSRDRHARKMHRALGRIERLAAGEDFLGRRARRKADRLKSKLIRQEQAEEARAAQTDGGAPDDDLDDL